MSRKVSCINGLRVGGGYATRGRKGFTLVELLVVIIIIGILAGAAMLASGGGTAAARAAVIINNLKSLKAAALGYYADNGGWPEGSYWDDDDNQHNGVERLFPYLDSDILANEEYLLISDRKIVNSYNTPNGGCNEYTESLFGLYDVSKESSAVREKLAAQADKIGLLGSNDDCYDHKYLATDRYVALLIAPNICTYREEYDCQ